SSFGRRWMDRAAARRGRGPSSDDPAVGWTLQMWPGRAWDVRLPVDAARRALGGDLHRRPLHGGCGRVNQMPLSELAGQGMRLRNLAEEDLLAWGEELGASIDSPAVLVLRGDLAAGKTTLARAIARGAGVRGTIPSPTYNLLFRYELPNGAAVVHVDLYR